MGGNGESKRLVWIKWDDLCKNKEEGGLGIKDLLVFNKALIGKWIWRYLNDGGSLWARVITSRHGVPLWKSRGVAGAGGVRGKTGWWKWVSGLVEKREGDWFWGNVEFRLGEGWTAGFWDRVWAGEKSLKERFPRLFQLAVNKEGTIKEMGRWEGGRWVWEVTWRRELRDWEQQGVTEFFDFLHQVKLEEGGSDRWVWKEGVGGEFQVKRAYKAILKQGGGQRIEEQHRQGMGKVWNSLAPVKAQVTTWRILQNRLPTLDNLSKRMEIDEVKTICCYCKVDVETAKHLFLDCREVSKLWYRMAEWIGAEWAAPQSIEHLMSNFGGLLSDAGKIKKRLLGLWVCVVWVLWKWRNLVRFEHKD